MGDYDSRTKEYVEHLIKQQLQGVEGPGRNDAYPIAASFSLTFENDEFLRGEYERCRRMAASDNDGDEDSVPSFDAERYRVTEPKGDKKDVIAWKLAVRNAMLQYEYQAKRLMSLELLSDSLDVLADRDQNALKSLAKSMRYERLRMSSMASFLETRTSLLKKQYGDLTLSEDSWRHVLAANPRIHVNNVEK